MTCLRAGVRAFAHPAVAEALQAAGVEGEIKGLLSDARATYQKKVICRCTVQGVCSS